MNQELLAVRVLKSKYFPIGDIIKITLASSPSFVWINLFWEKGLLSYGLIWCAGDGRKVNANTDR